MRSSSLLLLPTFVLSAAASLAQTGFTTRSFPAAGDGILQVADFNHDGRPDVFGFGAIDTRGPISVGHIYLNDGNGGFKAPISLPTSASVGTITYAKITDVNSDGTPDIVACTYTPSDQKNHLTVFLNDGSGNFSIGQTTLLAGGCNGLVVGDVNFDHREDVVLISSAQVSGASQPALITYFGDGTGKFGSPVTQTGLNFDAPPDYVGCGPRDITGGNFYFDSQFSLLLSTTCSTSNYGQYGTTFLGHGDGTGHFALALSRKGQGVFANSQTVDLNRDGRPDAIFTALDVASPSYYAYSVYTATNNGSGSFTYNEVANTDGFFGVAAADLNGDGLVDLAATGISGNNNNYPPPPNVITTYLRSASGTYTTGQTWTVGNSSSGIGNIVAADFNGDGYSDLLTITHDYKSGGDSLYLYTQQAPAATGCVPSSAGVMICAPKPGSTASSPVTITAGALAQSGNITAIRAYLDNVAVFTTNNPTAAKSQQVSQSVTVASGTHRLVVVAYQSTGSSISSTESFTVGGTAPCYPASAGARICSPTQNATVSSPVTIVAGATAGSGNLTAIRVYVDGVAKSLINNPQASKSFAINTPVSISAGTHTIVVVGYQSTGGSVSASDSITVK